MDGLKHVSEGLCDHLALRTSDYPHTLVYTNTWFFKYTYDIQSIILNSVIKLLRIKR